MLEDMVKAWELQLLAGVIRPDLPEEMRRQLAAAFWEANYLRHSGICQVLPPDFPKPPVPPPGPLPPPPPEAFRMHQGVLAEIVDLYTGNAAPDSDLHSILQDLRLSAARTLSQKLNSALQQLNQEIAQLEQQI